MESSRYVNHLFIFLLHLCLEKIIQPKATASYRLHPLIILNPENPVPLHLAKKFASCFSPGVVTVDEDGEVSIDEKNMRKDSVSREVLRHKEFEGCVQLKRIRDWFICTFLMQRLFP